MTEPTRTDLTKPDLASALEDLGPEEAAKAARTAIDAALENFTPAEREAFWNAIGLYYSTRRHPGAGESKPGPAEA